MTQGPLLSQGGPREPFIHSFFLLNAVVKAVPCYWELRCVMCCFESNMHEI